MKNYIKEIVMVQCKKCGWKQRVWNNKISQLKCSCGGKTLKNWEILNEEEKQNEV